MTDARTVARRARVLLPVVLEERGRLAEARRLERYARHARTVRGAALVLHAVGRPAEAPGLMIDPPFPVDVLHDLVGHLRRRYVLVRASELLPRARARQPREPIPVALTFDDDLRSHADAAAPALREHGAVGTVFLCGTTESFWWQLLQGAVDAGALLPDHLPAVDGGLVQGAVGRQAGAIQRLAQAVEALPADDRNRAIAGLAGLAPPQPPLLDAAGRRCLAQAGWEIGFHTHRHDPLPALGDAELDLAVVEGRDRLPGLALPTFAYPFGKASAREAAVVRAAGYAAAFTGVWSVVTRSTDAHLVPRLQPHPASPGRTVLALARALATT